MNDDDITLNDDDKAFLRKHREYGFADRSSMVREALKFYRTRLDSDILSDSAARYAALLDDDEELRDLDAQSLEDWPE